MIFTHDINQVFYLPFSSRIFFLSNKILQAFVTGQTLDIFYSVFHKAQLSSRTTFTLVPASLVDRAVIY